MVKCLECGKELKNIQYTHFKYKCNGNVSSLKEYKLKYPNCQLVSEEVKKISSVTLQNMINKYGEIEGIIKWDEYRDKQRKTNSFEYFEKTRGWSREQFNEYNKSRGVTKDNLIKKHGEEKGIKIYENYCKKQSKNGNKIEYFIEKFGEKEGTIKYNELCKKKAITLENFISKYGEEQGLIKFHKIVESKKGNYVSKLGIEFVKLLYEKIPNNWIFHEGMYGKEFCVYKDRPYFYDFVITSPFMACIEFNGDYWHANPLIYSSEQIIQYPNQEFIKAQDVWKKDEIKIKAIKDRGYNIKIVWEKDFIENKSNCVNEVFEWLMLLEKKSQN